MIYDVRCKIKRGRDCIAQFLPLFVFDLPPTQGEHNGSFSRFRFVKAAKPSARARKYKQKGKFFLFAWYFAHLIVPLQKILEWQER